VIARWAAGVIVLTAAASAAAAEDVTTLETKLDRATTELATSDCTSACKALASIRRAADRICELEPGPRCDAAQSKAEDATKRVRDACPECAVAQLKKKDEPRDERAMADSVPSSPTAMAPPPSESRGGCRNCATTPGSSTPDAGDFAVFALAALALGASRKKNRTRV